MAINNRRPMVDPVCPGYTLLMELKERGIKQKDFAAQIGMRPSHLNEIIKGKRVITKAIADKLEKGLGISSRFWVNRQLNYLYDLQTVVDPSEGKNYSINNDLYSEPTNLVLRDIESENTSESMIAEGRKQERDRIINILLENGVSEDIIALI